MRPANLASTVLLAGALTLLSASFVDANKAGYDDCIHKMSTPEIHLKMSTAETIMCSTIVHDYEVERETKKHEEELAAVKRAKEKAEAEALARKLKEEKAKADAEAAEKHEREEAAAKAKAARDKRDAATAAEKKRVEEIEAKKRAEEHRKRAQEQQAKLDSAMSVHNDHQAKSRELQECETSLKDQATVYQERLPECIVIDPLIAPIFNIFPINGVLYTLLAALAGFFLFFGSTIGNTTGTSWVTLHKNSKCRIKEVIVRPGSEVVVLSNGFTGPDLDMTGATLVVGPNVFQFDDGFNFARGTTLEIHAGPDAKMVKTEQAQLDDHDKFDSRRISSIYWTSASIFMEHGANEATLKSGEDEIVSFWGQD